MKARTLLFLLLIACSTLPTFAQRREQQGYKFSNEELKEMLLYKSKKQKTKGIVALITGPAIATFGVLLISNNQHPGYRDGFHAGHVISTAGILTTFSGFAYFSSAARLKRRASRPATGSEMDLLFKE
jgi:hypothetical protein